MDEKRDPIDHELKCDPYWFSKVMHCRKNFEIRKHDRDFQEGDRIILREYDRGTNRYVEDHSLTFVISLVMTSVDHEGIAPGFCALGLQTQVPRTK